MILDGIDYKTKVAVEQRVKSILKSYQPGERLSDCDERLIIDLINYHPHADQKIGCGIDQIVVDKTPPYNSIGMWIVRLDRSRTDFSYKICLNGLPTPRAMFSAAARSAVQFSISVYRDELFERDVTCPMTGKQLSKLDCHIDHAPPNYFSRIVSDFILETGLDLSTVEYTDRGDGVATVHFSDWLLEDQFVFFHNARAVLRAVDKEWNVKAGNRSIA
jgi:hypothetical protein